MGQNYFVYGSFWRDRSGPFRAAYSVLNTFVIVEASYVSNVTSVHVAEEHALWLITNSQYGFSVVHDIKQWQSQNDFKTSSDSPVKKGFTFSISMKHYSCI